MCNDFMKTQKWCRKSIITLASIQTKEQKILCEKFKNLKIKMLDNINRYDEKINVWKAYLNVLI